VRREREPAVGGMTKLFHQLSPEDQQAVRHLYAMYDEQKELGSHGDTRTLLEQYNVEPDIAEAVHAGIDKDYVATELQRRRRKGNADLTLQPLTRRDHLEAAVDAHTDGNDGVSNDTSGAESFANDALNTNPKSEVRPATKARDRFNDRFTPGLTWREQPEAVRKAYLNRDRKG
jgi:hypothetical protein